MNLGVRGEIHKEQGRQHQSQSVLWEPRELSFLYAKCREIQASKEKEERASLQGLEGQVELRI